MFRRLIEGLCERIPSQCTVCHQWPSRLLCEACVDAFAQPVHRCSTCALPVPGGMRQCGRCVTAPMALDQALAAVSYAYPWARMVQDFKFHAQTAWARHMALLMRSAPWVEPALEAADCVLPMPLSRQRLQERGFNQALLLARALEQRKTRPDWLLRIQHTAPQSSLHREDRWHSLQGAFAMDPLHHAQLQGLRVVIVDDVMTTGASLHAAAQVVRAAGARHVTGLVFARTE